MFRGGDYIDNKNFADHRQKPGYNYMQTDDIEGARPKRLHQIKGSKMQSVGANIMDNRLMEAAGVKQVAPVGQRGIMDCWSMGEQYHHYQSKQERNPLSVADVNGPRRN